MLCRVALAAVFGLAAWAKLTDFPRWRQSLDQHGLGPAVSGGVAWLVPVLEAGVAGGLLARFGDTIFYDAGALQKHSGFFG